MTARSSDSNSMQMLGRLAFAAAMVAAMSGCRARSHTSAQLDFNRDVQPILASNCFSCHGPDPGNRKAGLRLDLQESAFRKRAGHPDAIVAGHPELSELIKRIESHDAHHLMPQSPQGEAKPMKPEEIALLKEWVKEGAGYRPHWAFDAPVKAESPGVFQAHSPIDGFIQARLAKENLHPSPEADRPTLIRRVTLDLTGLLPTPAEVEAYVHDGSPNAYERLVDGLLARPAFGEARARYWLDYTRYADTYGLHFDNQRSASPYRDYLIRSFNANKPFDQFAMEQIAGDMMPAKDLDTLLASGYVRAGISSNEGGTIPEELRVNLARERTEAYGAAFLGLTVGCAVCHDHKYDPTSQKDFYALSAFFNNLTEQPYNGDKPNWAPLIRLPKPEKQEAYNGLWARRSQLAAELRASRADEASLVARWVKSGRDIPQAVSEDKLQLRLRLDEGSGDLVHNTAPRPAQASFPVGKGKPQWGETTWLWPDFRLDTTTRIDLGQTGDFEWNQPFSSGAWIRLRASASGNGYDVTGSLISKMDTTAHFRGWDISTRKGVVIVQLVDEEPKGHEPKDLPNAAVPKLPFHYPVAAKPVKKAAEKPEAKKPEAKKPEPKKPAPGVSVDSTPLHAIKVALADRLPTEDGWSHVFFTYDGSGRAAGLKIYIDGRPAPTRVLSDTLRTGSAVPSIRTQAPMQLGWRFPETDPAHDTRYQDVRLYARALSAQEVERLPYEDYAAELVAKPGKQWNADQLHALGSYYFDRIDDSARAKQLEIAKIDEEMVQLSEGGDLSIIAMEKPSIAYANVLSRGVYSARMERVAADTPHYLPPLPANEPHDRLALAKWTVSAKNPLTARVTVNRMWYELFGTGLVETTEDFGIMGGRPTHPELLDWLAVEFRESGWNIKHMYKLMVMSAAYRQSARSTPEQLAKDPKNLLLAHGPRFRMDAEMLRDIALESSGLLVNRVGGPSVKTYQPQNVWEQVSYPRSDTVKYTQDHGDALYRRSMYTFWKRMAIMPDMDAFDAPMRDTVCTRRQRTDTPLQALVTMNDVQWVEASRALAQRVIQQGSADPGKRIRMMSDILLAHDATPQMSAVLEGSLEKMRKHYAADPKAAKALIAVGESRSDPSIPAPELAAWTMVASEMLNLDETVTK